MTDLERYTEACNYPGQLDEAVVQRSLAEYCRALGISREIKRINRPWWRELEILETVIEVAGSSRDARAARDARDALAARAARDARDALAARDARDALAARGNQEMKERLWRRR